MSIKRDDIVVCSACGTVSEAKRRGSGGMELFLWLFLLWPIAVIYSIWRSGGGKCATCGAAALIPVTAPKAHQMAGNTEEAAIGIQKTVEEIHDRKAKQKATDAKIWKAFFFIIGGIFVLGIVSVIVGPENQNIVTGVLLAIGLLIYTAAKARKSSDNNVHAGDNPHE